MILSHSDMGARDCGTSAELRTQLICALTFGERAHIHTNMLHQYLGCTFNARETHGQMYIMQPKL